MQISGGIIERFCVLCKDKEMVSIISPYQAYTIIFALLGRLEVDDMEDLREEVMVCLSNAGEAE